MNNPINKITLNLSIGFQDKGKLHKKIQIGNLVKAEQLFIADAIYNDENNVLSKFHIMRFSISKFGSLDCPVTLETILSLDSLDLDILTDAIDTFTSKNGGDEMQFLDEKTFKLAHPINREGVNFDLIEFGRIENGYDVANSENCVGTFQQNAFFAGCRVKTLKQSNGEAVLESQLNLNEIGGLWFYEVLNLIRQSLNWKEQVRKQRADQKV